jgi:hypothetical protein
MPRVLTTNAFIICPHGGRGVSTASDPKWSINNGMVLLEDDIGSLETGGIPCPFLDYPCIGYQLQSMGLNATQVDGRQVILETDFNQTLTGLPLLITDFHQTFDNSTVAPVPPGQSAPSLPPELADMVKPLVTAIPSTLTFDSTTMSPSSYTITFTLFSAYPLKWILTLINVPQQYNLDITNGLPAQGLVVMPADGSWSTPNLTVTVNMTAQYMASLGVDLPGQEHDFYMTAVSQRGLSNYSKVVLTVS